MKCLGFVRGKLECEVDIYGEGLGEDGNRRLAARYCGRGFLQESGREVMDRDGRKVKIAGRILIEGDVAPGVDFIGSGVVRVVVGGESRQMRIFEGNRGRGMDGLVSHTVLRLV